MSVNFHEIKHSSGEKTVQRPFYSIFLRIYLLSQVTRDWMLCLFLRRHNWVIISDEHCDDLKNPIGFLKLSQISQELRFKLVPYKSVCPCKQWNVPAPLLSGTPRVSMQHILKGQIFLDFIFSYWCPHIAWLVIYAPMTWYSLVSLSMMIDNKMTETRLTDYKLFDTTSRKFSNYSQSKYLLHFMICLFGNSKMVTHSHVWIWIHLEACEGKIHFACMSYLYREIYRLNWERANHTGHSALVFYPKVYGPIPHNWLLIVM